MNGNVSIPVHSNGNVSEVPKVSNDDTSIHPAPGVATIMHPPNAATSNNSATNINGGTTTNNSSNCSISNNHHSDTSATTITTGSSNNNSNPSIAVTTNGNLSSR